MAANNSNSTVQVLPTSSGRPFKKRRTPGACDVCKRRKIRCDSSQMPDNRCSHCAEYGFDCTHKEAIKTLGAAKGYVESLEARLEKMDRLLEKFLPPGADINKEIDQLELVESPAPEPLPRNDDDDDPTVLRAFQYRKEKRYFGKSSGLRLLQTAIEVKQEYIGETIQVKPLLSRERHEIWNYPSWALSNPESEQDFPDYVYPDEDLAPSLIGAYFDQINHFLPLLHRPTFEKSVAEGLHNIDSGFGAVYSLVCAHEARYSTDLRVLADGTDSPRSAGWRWYEQVNVFRNSFVKKTALYELQMIALHTMFVQTTEAPQGAWVGIGLGVRLAQEVGLHRRRRRKDAAPSTQDELWKRAFWVIVSLDRTISSFSGRPCCLQDEDLDSDLPVECDDEYWECGFQQPPNKPSSIAYFNLFLGLMDILASAMRLIYPIKRPRHVSGQSVPLSEQEIVAGLDSTMNNWIDSVPTHLKWNPDCENQLFLKQSAALHAIYYYLQIYIHRPFIPSPRNPVPGVFPSLAICTNAARSCCHVLETFTRSSSLPLAKLQMAVFTSVVILLLNIWSGKRSGYAPHPLRDLIDVQRCLEILKACEGRWASAARYRDILTELASAGDLSIPNTHLCTSPSLGQKRNRETLNDETTKKSTPVSSTNDYRDMMGGERVLLSKIQAPAPQRPALFSLPMYGNELGRLPIYGQFNFSNSFGTQDAPSQPINLDQFTSADRRFLPEHSFSGQTSESFQDPSAADSVSADLATIFSSPFDNDATEVWFQGMPVMDNDTINMWSMAPTNLELDDWNTYLSSMEQVTQARGQRYE